MDFIITKEDRSPIAFDKYHKDYPEADGYIGYIIYEDNTVYGILGVSYQVENDNWIEYKTRNGLMLLPYGKGVAYPNKMKAWLYGAHKDNNFASELPKKTIKSIMLYYGYEDFWRKKDEIKMSKMQI